MAGEVNMTTTLSRDVVAAIDQPQALYVLMEMLPNQMMANVSMPLNFSLVLDKSGSMAVDGKIQSLKEAVAEVIKMLGPSDTISIITFDTSTKALVESQSVRDDRDRNSIWNKVRGINADGGTAMAPAMRKGIDLVRRKFSPAAVNQIVLLTDGQTEGEDACKREAQAAAQAQIPILALGLGADWNTDLLVGLASVSGGQAEYLQSAAEIVPYFKNAVSTMQASIVRNAALTLRLVNGVEPRRVWRVVPQISDLGRAPLSDRSIFVPLGDLDKQDGQAILVDLLLHPRPQGSYRVAQAELSYDVPLLNLTGQRLLADLMLHVTADPVLAQRVNPRVMNVAERVQAFKLQTRALDEARAGNVLAATQILKTVHTMLLDQGELEKARTVRLEADQLEQSGKMSEEGARTIQFKSGKTRRLDQP